MLTLLHNSGHQYSCFPPHSDEGLEICFADPPLAAEAVGHQVAALDPTSNCLSRYLHVLCRLLYGEQGGEGMFGLNASIIAHVVLLRGWVGGKSLYWEKIRTVLVTIRDTLGQHSAQAGVLGPASYRFAVCLEGMRASRSSPGF